jgi:hypothetical protein
VKGVWRKKAAAEAVIKARLAVDTKKFKPTARFKTRLVDETWYEKA